MKLVLTCEHAYNNIPRKYQGLFLKAEKILNSHRGYDPGALELFKTLEELAYFSQVQETGRLLVEVNRSIKHPQLFSEFTKKLPRREKLEVLDTYYFPYRNSVETQISRLIEKGEKALHLSVHTFTPYLNEEVRNTGIGLLYDSSRKMEKHFCKNFKRYLNEQNPHLKIRFNYPYLGKADGFTTYLRKKFPEDYMGIELEVNQNFVINNQMNSAIKKQIFFALKEAFISYE